MNLKNKKFLIFSVIILILVGIFCYFRFYYKKIIVSVGGKEFVALVASNKMQLIRGLSGRKFLEDNGGMLFVFDTPYRYAFWMKEMNFPLDIVWISDTKKIVHIEKSVATSTYPNLLYPTSPALYVLEVNAGEIEKLNIKIGDNVEFLKK